MPHYILLSKLTDEGWKTIKARPERIKEVKATGSELLITACPFCELNLNDSVEGDNESIKVKDIIELVDENIKS